MPRKSTGKAKIPDRIPAFKSEAEEADWWASPSGRRHSARSFEKAMRKGIIETELRDWKTVKQVMEHNPGHLVRVKRGLNIKPTDPAVLEEIMARVQAKQTQAISLRLPRADIEAAKALASEAGIGYQTLLKELIHEGLRRRT